MLSVFLDILYFIIYRASEKVCIIFVRAKLRLVHWCKLHNLDLLGYVTFNDVLRPGLARFESPLIVSIVSFLLFLFNLLEKTESVRLPHDFVLALAQPCAISHILIQLLQKEHALDLVLLTWELASYIHNGVGDSTWMEKLSLWLLIRFFLGLNRPKESFFEEFFLLVKGLPE